MMFETNPMKINVRVIPRAKQTKVEFGADGTLRVHTTAAPADGQANAAVVKLLAAHFDVAKSRIKIIRGETGRNKTIEISD